VCVGFGQIANVEFNFLAFGTFSNGEVKPKNVASCVRINPQK